MPDTTFVYEGDVATQIILNAGYDLGTPTVLQIKYKKPSGATGNWTASVTETTKALATVQNGDLDEDGLWIFQIYAELQGGWKGHGRVFRHRIQIVEVD
jgi:hypothetical protein